MRIDRHVASVAVLAVFLAFNVATSKSKSGSTTGSPTATPTALATGAAGSLADIDPRAIKSSLGCGSGKDACRILDEFASATTLDETPPSDTTKVWMGQTFALGGSADGKRQYFFLQIRRGTAAAPSNVPATDLLPTTGSARWLRPENADEERDAAAVFKALESGSPLPARSGARDFIRKPAPASDTYPMAKTSGVSIAVVRRDSASAYLRKTGKRVLSIEYSNGDLLDNAKVWCAEAWPVP